MKINSLIIYFILHKYNKEEESRRVYIIIFVKIERKREREDDDVL